MTCIDTEPAFQMIKDIDYSKVHTDKFTHCMLLFFLIKINISHVEYILENIIIYLHYLHFTTLRWHR